MRKHNTQRRAFLKAAGATGAASLIGLAGCSQGGDGGDSTTTNNGGGTTTGTTQQAEDIVIGNAAPLSGNTAPWGQLHRNGFEFAMQEINNNGGVLGGRNLSLVSQDTQGNPQEAATAIRRLVNNENAVAVTGPVLSDVAIRARRVAEELQVPHFPNQGSSPALLTKDTRYTFRVGGTATPTFVNAAASLIQQRGYSTYGAIVADYAYGHSYQAGIERYLQDMDGLDVTVEVAPVGTSDFSSYLRRMPDDIEYLDAAGHPVGIYSILPQSSEIGLEPEVRAGPNIPTPLFYETIGDDISNGVTLYPSIDASSDKFQEVAQRYGEEHDALFDQFHAFGYVTANLLAAAIEEAGEAEPQAIRDAVSSIEYDSILAYSNISYTEWGELENAQLTGMQFTNEAPSYYPDADYGYETLFKTEPFEPIDPEDW